MADLVVAVTFGPPDAVASYERWRAGNERLLLDLAPESIRVDTERIQSGGTFIHVWLPREVAERNWLW